jgi:hypothetical protein
MDSFSFPADCHMCNVEREAWPGLVSGSFDAKGSSRWHLLVMVRVRSELLTYAFSTSLAELADQELSVAVRRIPYATSIS